MHQSIAYFSRSVMNAAPLRLHRGRGTALLNLEFPEQHDVGFTTGKARPHALHSLANIMGLRNGFSHACGAGIGRVYRERLKDVNKRPSSRFC